MRRELLHSVVRMQCRHKCIVRLCVAKCSESGGHVLLVWYTQTHSCLKNGDRSGLATTE